MNGEATSERNVYSSMSVGSGVGIGIPVSIGITHQNFKNNNEIRKNGMYSDRIVGEGYELDGNLFGVNKGFGISKERIDSMTDGIHVGGDMFSGNINYTNSWKLEYTSPLTLDDVKDEAEDDDGRLLD